jgi:hypothetical protein
MDPRRTPRPDQPAGSDLGRPPIAVRIGDSGGIAAALPQLLGFRPRESVVLVGLSGARGGRVGLCVRADIPPAEHAAALAAVLTRSVRTGRPRTVLVAVVSEATGPPEDLPHRRLVGELVRALTSAAIPVPEIMLVRGGRWWSYDCPQPCCSPGAGTPLPAGVTELEAAAVAAGTVVEDDRDALTARIAGPDGRAREAMAEVCTAVAAECSREVLDTGWDAVAAESWAAVTAAVGLCRPGAGRRLGDREIARVVCGLRDAEVRDRALELALGSDAPAAEQLWTECTRRAPAPLDAAPATLLAVSAWLRGDGAMANVALGRALAAEPGYSLALLLSQALGACLPPDELRALLHATTVRPGPRSPAG